MLMKVFFINFGELNYTYLNVSIVVNTSLSHFVSNINFFQTPVRRLFVEAFTKVSV